MKRRSGITLIEVLVAIFIMAIGLIALLALFPLGILRMAQSIRDSRTGQAGQNAHTVSILQDIRNDLLVISDKPTGGITDDFFVNPGYYVAGAKVLPDADPFAESYPVLVDPIGYGAAAGSGTDWVGAVPGHLRRRPVGFTGGVVANIYKNFSLLDDMPFDPFTQPGSPQLTPAPANFVKRDTRFSWAYLMRRPQAQDKSIVDCSVIVFDQRSLSLTNSLALEEYVYTGKTPALNDVAVFDPGSNSITIDYSSPLAIPPPVRPGDWILDSTQFSPSAGKGSANAFFYRVVAVDELGGSKVRFEVQNTIRGYPARTGAPYAGTAIVMRGIAEVFDKGTVRLP
jgi:hypothetical protein